jgi:bacterioferritin-associated ferredoxin
MYICICKGITEEQIISLLKMGLSRGEVLRRLGVGEDCGVCVVQSVDKLIKRYQENK